MPSRQAPFEINGHSVPPGSRQTIDLPISVLSDHTPMTMAVHVVHGRRPGPTMFVSAAIHGDEIIGVEIVRRLLRAPQLKSLRGTLLVVPIVNGFGFMNHSRYLPDRRDLNRSFPGSAQGSLAGRLAHLFMEEIVRRSDVGIDLHSAAIHRVNLPQIRASSMEQDVLALAEAFAAPLTLVSKIRDGSLRHAAKEVGVNVLVFEGGEGLRFDETAVRAGVTGILRVMHIMEMVPAKGIQKPKAATLLSRSSSWVRAPAGGLFRAFKTTGDTVRAGDILAVVSDPLGDVEETVVSEGPGVIVGRSNLPVVNEGDALFHVAKTGPRRDAAKALEVQQNQLDADPLFDEDEII